MKSWTFQSKLDLLSIFDRCDQFPQDFGQLRERIVPYLTEMVRAYSIVACPVVLNLICDQNLEAGVLKFKNSGHF